MAGTSRPENWSPANTGLDDLSVQTLALAPTYALTPTLLAGTPGGLYRSDDGGDTWKYEDWLGGAYQGDQEPAVNDVVFSPDYAHDQTVWVGAQGGLFRSIPDPVEQLPSPRKLHGAIHDTVHNRMVLFGGMSDSYVDLNDVWTLDLAMPGVETWTKLSPAGVPPSARSSNAIYDAVHDRMIVFGGRGVGSSLYNDVWALDLSTPGAEVWTELDPLGSPPLARCAHSAIYDAVHGRMIVFGGVDDDRNYLDDLWALDLTLGAETWTQPSPTGTLPSARRRHSAVYDAPRSRMLLFGGETDDGYLNDVWALDLGTPGAETWDQLDPYGLLPPGREDHMAVYDAAHERMVVFGGDYDNGWQLLNDAWALDLSAPGAENWSQLPTENYFGGQDVSSLAVSPGFGADDTLILASQDTLYRSSDGGQTWSAPSDLPGVTDLLFSPTYASDQTLYAVANGDVHHSSDGGYTWTALGEGLGADSLALASQGHSRTLFAATQSGVWRYTFPRVETVYTLILTHQGRVRERYGPQAADALLERLYDLAEHPQVGGLVVDLGDEEAFPQVAAAYAAWDASSPVSGTLHLGDTPSANQVAQAIRDVVLDHTASFSNTQYLVLVGHDEIIPPPPARRHRRTLAPLRRLRPHHRHYRHRPGRPHDPLRRPLRLPLQSPIPNPTPLRFGD
jgi:photosystem II stability/assembly factor-like uncharacterized protein